MTHSSTLSAWPASALARFGAANEIEISTRCRDQAVAATLRLAPQS
jgi:hypothetical protein